MSVPTLIRQLAAALCALALTPAIAAASQQPIWSYSRPATLGTHTERVRVAMRDGVRLACQLTRPVRDGRVVADPRPTLIYEVTPYAAADAVWLEQGVYFAARGYAAISCAVRGTGLSGGAYPQINQPAEQTDAYDLVEWAAAQPWSNGRVGQFGESYGGMMTFRAAAARPPHLVAVAPQQAPNDLYLDNVYPGGIRLTPVTHQVWPLVAQVASLGRIDAGRVLVTQGRHPLRDAFWEQIAIDSVLDQIDVPVLSVAGWNDPLFRNGAIRNHERLAARRPATSYLIAGPWTHGLPADWRMCRVIAAACGGSNLMPRGVLLAWFDRWLGVNSAAPLPAAAVTSFQHPAGSGAGWRTREQVFTATEQLALHLTERRTLTAGEPTAGAVRWTADPLDGLVRAAPRQAFTSEPFPAAVELSGRPRLRLRVSSSGADAHLLAALHWIRPSGSAREIGRGALKASHRAGHARPTPLRPGQPTELEFELEPLDFRLPAGSRLQLRLTSGSARDVVPLPRRTQLTLHTAASTLLVPTSAAPSG